MIPLPLKAIASTHYRPAKGRNNRQRAVPRSTDS
jgi:hypothetical protein